jgi:hypothetical protein
MWLFPELICIAHDGADPAAACCSSNASDRMPLILLHHAPRQLRIALNSDPICHAAGELPLQFYQIQRGGG